MMYTLEQIEEEFAPYRNRYGFVSAGGDHGHNTLFHAFYVNLLDRYKLLNLATTKKEIQLFNTLIDPKYPGILRSAPVGFPNANPHSHDSLKGAFWLCHKLKDYSRRFYPVGQINFAKDFLNHGRLHKWNWNPKDPNKFDLHGTYWRFPGMIAQAQVAAGETPHPFNKYWLYAELALSAKKSKGRIERMTLPFWMCKTIKGISPMADMFVGHWRENAYRKYPGGMGEVFESWGGPWKTHPFTKHYAGLFDV